MARKGDAVHGVLLLDKARGQSSNAALQSARRLLNAAKAGHTGTLDPEASGLLPITFGEAAKFSADLLDADKSYEADLLLGVTTSTGDVEGDVTERRPVRFTDEDLARVIERFTGPIEQVPPMHSAVKMGGVPLYKMARKGVSVERPPRHVVIRSLKVASRTPDTLRLVVTCSKGTYIRVLAEDIGKALGCGAHLTALRRTAVGSLHIDQAVTLEDLSGRDLQARREALEPVDRLLRTLPALRLEDALAARFRNGQRLSVGCPLRGRIRVYRGENELLGTAQVSDRGVVSPERLTAFENEEIKDDSCTP